MVRSEGTGPESFLDACQFRVYCVSSRDEFVAR